MKKRSEFRKKVWSTADSLFSKALKPNSKEVTPKKQTSALHKDRLILEGIFNLVPYCADHSNQKWTVENSDFAHFLKAWNEIKNTFQD